MLDSTQEEVYNANIMLGKSGLNTNLGNVSGISRTEGRIVIKPTVLTMTLTVDALWL